MFSIMFKSGDFGEKLTTFPLFSFRYVVVDLARWAGAHGKTPMHNEVKILQFPECLVNFVLLLLLIIVGARFFETMSTFYQ